MKHGSPVHKTSFLTKTAATYLTTFHKQVLPKTFFFFGNLGIQILAFHMKEQRPTARWIQVHECAHTFMHMKLLK